MREFDLVREVRQSFPKEGMSELKFKRMCVYLVKGGRWIMRSNTGRRKRINKEFLWGKTSIK